MDSGFVYCPECLLGPALRKRDRQMIRINMGRRFKDSGFVEAWL